MGVLPFPALRDRSFRGINFNPVLELVVSVAQRCPARIDSLLVVLALGLSQKFGNRPLRRAIPSLCPSLDDRLRNFFLHAELGNSWEQLIF
jgi:hypothetical protein